jgi:type II secretory pathway component PulJ
LRAFTSRRGRAGAGGFTLLEVLVSGALFSVVVGGVYLLYTTMQGTLIRGEMKSDLQQNARTGLDRMLPELRMAGYDPQNALGQVATQKFVALRAAGASCLSFVTYRIVGGVERSVRVTYTLNGTELERSSADWDVSASAFSGGSTQPVASSVNQLTFAYFDTVNALLQPSAASAGACPPGGASSVPLLSGDQAGRVRRIGVTLRTLDSRPRTPAESYTVTSYVYLRNQ